MADFTPHPYPPVLHSDELDQTL